MLIKGCQLKRTGMERDCRRNNIEWRGQGGDVMGGGCARHGCGAPSQVVEGGEEGGSGVGRAWVGLTSLSTKLYHNTNNRI